MWEWKIYSYIYKIWLIRGRNRILVEISHKLSYNTEFYWKLLLTVIWNLYKKYGIITEIMRHLYRTTPYTQFKMKFKPSCYALGFIYPANPPVSQSGLLDFLFATCGKSFHFNTLCSGVMLIIFISIVLLRIPTAVADLTAKQGSKDSNITLVTVKEV